VYKLTYPDGYDFYSGSINYREAIGSTIRVHDYDPPEVGVCGKGLHASKNPNDCFAIAKIPCAAFRVKGIDLIVKDEEESRFQSLKVIEEIFDLDKLFGWKYSELINSANPFMIPTPEITDEHIRLLGNWISIINKIKGISELIWYSIGNSVKDVVIIAGDYVWGNIGKRCGDYIRNSAKDIGPTCESAWDITWNITWAYIGSLFPDIKKWKGINHKPGEYPFQSAVDLWNMGLIPSFDGNTWRLHAGPKGEIVYARKK